MLHILMRRIIRGNLAGFVGSFPAGRWTTGTAALALVGCAIAAAPSDARASESLRLPNVGLVLVLPDNNAGWQTVPSQTGLKGDLVARTRPSSPLISMNVQLVRGQGSCQDFIAGMAKEKGKVVQSPAYLPPGYSSGVNERVLQPGREMAAVCANVRAGVLVASIVYDGALNSADFRTVRPFLSALVQAGNNASAPPAPAPPASRGTKTVTLKNTGLTLTIPSVWEAVEDKGTDGLIRTDLNELLGISLTSRMSYRNCGEWESTYRREVTCVWSTRPSYAPARYSAAVCDETVNGTAHRGTMCLERESGGVLLAQVLRPGPLSAPIVLEAKPILELIATAAKGVAPASPTPTPAPTPTPTPAPTQTSQRALPATPPPSSSYSSSSSSSYDHDDDDGDYDSDFDESTGRALTLEFGVHQLKPDSSAFDKALGGTIGLRGHRIEGKGTVGLAWSYNAMLGYQQQKNLPFDAEGRVGVGVRFWHIQLAPMLGIGADSIAGGSPYKVYAAVNYHVEAMASIQLTRAFSISGSAGRYFRSGDEPDPALRVNRENRFSGQLNFSSVSVGARFVNYGSARLIGGTLGLSF